MSRCRRRSPRFSGCCTSSTYSMWAVCRRYMSASFFFFQAEDGIRDLTVTGVQTCALPICLATAPARKKVNTPAGGTPSSTTSRVSGASVVVSSVPETRPMAANTTAPISPMAAATAMSLVSRASISCPPGLVGKQLVELELLEFLHHGGRQVLHRAQASGLARQFLQYFAAPFGVVRGVQLGHFPLGRKGACADHAGDHAAGQAREHGVGVGQLARLDHRDQPAAGQVEAQHADAGADGNRPGQVAQVHGVAPDLGQPPVGGILACHVCLLGFLFVWPRAGQALARSAASTSSARSVRTSCSAASWRATASTSSPVAPATRAMLRACRAMWPR